MNQEQELIAGLSVRIGYSFQEPLHLLQAATHKSFANEAPADEPVAHNERLEFLGDAVLGLVVSEWLMDAHPEFAEGELSRMRAALVNEQQLYQAAVRLEFGQWIRLGKGEEKSGGRDKPSLLADMVEAILGAVFLDGGLQQARKVTRQILGYMLEKVVESSSVFDPKSRLQEMFQQKGHPPPEYRVIQTEGPEHCRRFTVAVRTEDGELGTGEGGSKKEAEQNAARAVLETSNDSPVTPGDEEPQDQ
jgi:ribonuclease III